MLQSVIVVIFATITGLLGVFANIKGGSSVKSLAIFAILFSVFVYFSDYQIQCLVKGRCIYSSWLAVGVLLITLYGIAYAYYVGLHVKATVANNNVVFDATMNTSNPIVRNILTYLETHYKISV
jgi:hypothetical protein